MSTENVADKKKIAVMGGSFDPCHIGHINLAVDAKEQMNLEKVIFVPTKIQPFKIGNYVAPDEDRVNMLNIAISGISGLEVSKIEICRDGISYTYKTLRDLKKILGDGYKVYFLAGTDTFLHIEKWNKSEELLRENCFLVGSRIGYREEKLKKVIDRIRKRYSSEIRIVHNRKFHISSTKIRDRVSRKLALADLIGEKVERYINEKGLYK